MSLWWKEMLARMKAERDASYAGLVSAGRIAELEAECDALKVRAERAEAAIRAMPDHPSPEVREAYAYGYREVLEDIYLGKVKGYRYERSEESDEPPPAA